MCAKRIYLETFSKLLMPNGFQKHEINLAGSKAEGSDIKSFIFAFTSGRFDFKAGQAVNLIANPSTPDELSREFSIASSPTEDYLLFTMRMLSESKFKTHLDSLPIGSAVVAEGPYGEFVLPEDSSRPLVFLAGGIGVTPYRGMLKFCADNSLPHNITLLYSVRTPDEIVYKEEWQKFQDSLPNFRLVITVTRPSGLQEGWRGRTGRIDANLITELVPDVKAPIFYVCGTPEMVRAMMKLLVGMGVAPQGIKVESFSGYKGTDE